MQTRKVRRFTAGKWNDIKWSDIKEGNVIRVFDREYNHHDGTINTFVATSDAYLEKDGWWRFQYDENKVMDNKSVHNVHDNVRAGTQRRWRNLKKRPKGSKKEK
jgi:hypothetical protein